MMKKIPSLFIVLIIIFSAMMITGCNSSSSTTNQHEVTKGTEEDGSDGDYPVTLINADREMTIDAAPERVVGLYQQEAELLAALDLEDKLVGYSIVTADTPAEYEEKLKDIEILAEDNYPSKEKLLEADPDFVIGSERTFNKNGVGTVDDLEKLGIVAYVTEAEQPETVESVVYKQIKEIAQIFGVEDRGEKLIQSLQAEIDEITDQIGDVDDPVKVLLMSGGGTESAQVSGGSSLDNHLIELAGGENIFADEDEYLFEASWEEIIDRNPDVIVTSYCCGTTPEDLEQMLVNKDSLQDVTAVKNNNYIAAQVEDTTGNVRVVRGLKKMAEGFYPEKFE